MFIFHRDRDGGEVGLDLKIEGLLLLGGEEGFRAEGTRLVVLEVLVQAVLMHEVATGERTTDPNGGLQVFHAYRHPTNERRVIGNR